MGIARVDTDKLQRSARLAASAQWQSLSRLRIDVGELEVHPLSNPDSHLDTIGVAAADAGLVAVELAPFALQFIHVADDRGRVHMAEILPLTTLDEDLEVIFTSHDVLQGFLDALECEWRDLSSLWHPSLKSDPALPRDVRLVADALREMAEWAVCLLLAQDDAPKDDSAPVTRIILHDGLLRSILLRERIVAEKLPAWWSETAWRHHRVAIAGVGKTSLMWQHLALTLDMDPRVQRMETGYIVIPQDLENKLSGRVQNEHRLGFGQLVLVKTRPDDVGSFLPVDLPAWIMRDVEIRETVLARIAHVSRTSFPQPGYPEPLGLAHEAAHLTNFDARVIRDFVIESLRGIVEPEKFEKMLRNWAFGERSWRKA